jgi:hypothetical protein
MKNKSKRDEELTQRTIKLINTGCDIYLKCKSGYHKGSYLHSWTNIAAGPDHAVWSGTIGRALEIFSLKWAFALARLYNCKVISYNRRQNIETIEKLNG